MQHSAYPLYGLAANTAVAERRSAQLRKSKGMIKIESDRIILRDIIESDINWIHEFSSDPLVVAQANWGPNRFKDTYLFLQEIIRSQKEIPRSNFDLAIVLNENKRLIGTCGVKIIDQKNLVGQLGIYLNKSYWNRGFGTEAAKKMIDYLFQNSIMIEVRGMTSPNNIKTLRLFIKLGMKPVRFIEKNKLLKNKWHDSMIFSLSCLSQK